MPRPIDLRHGPHDALAPNPERPTVYSVAAKIRSGASANDLTWASPHGPAPLWIEAAQAGPAALRGLARAGSSFAQHAGVGPLGFMESAPLESARWLLEATLDGTLPLIESPEVSWMAFRAHALRLFEARAVDHAHRGAPALDDSQRAKRFDLGLPAKPAPAEPFQDWAARLWLDRERLRALAGSPPPKFRAIADNRPHWLDAALRLGSLFCVNDPWVWARGLSQMFNAEMGSPQLSIIEDEWALAAWAGSVGSDACGALPLDLALAAKSGSPQAISCALAAGSKPAGTEVGVLLRSLALQWGVDLDATVAPPPSIIPMLHRAMNILARAGVEPEMVATQLLLSQSGPLQAAEAARLASDCLELLEASRAGITSSPSPVAKGITVADFFATHPLRAACQAVLRWAESHELHGACAAPADDARKRPSL